MAPRTLNLVVAACSNKGIGMNGKLPWVLRGDMAFFKKITTETQHSSKQNVVLMGRKTWDSIPAKFRPLGNRINVVLSTTMAETPGIHIIRSFDEIFEVMDSPALKDKVGDLYIIGGSSLYKEALSSHHPVRVFLTSVLQDFKCDTFLNEMDDIINKYKKTENLDIDSSLRHENGIDYKFEVFDKPAASESACVPPIKICVAMLQNHGIGFKGGLPWPFLKDDYEHYMALTGPKSDKKVVNIKGRATWEDTGLEEKTRPGIINIVVSSTLQELPEGADYLVKDFNAAIDISSKLYHDDIVNDVWVMGGQNIFQEAISSSLCTEIHMTKIQASFECDRFFPQFKHHYEEVKDGASVKEHEDNGIKYQFHVYRRLPEFCHS